MRRRKIVVATRVELQGREGREHWTWRMPSGGRVGVGHHTEAGALETSQEIRKRRSAQNDVHGGHQLYHGGLTL